MLFRITTVIGYSGYWWCVVWNKGITEGGSSGSPLINNNHKVIGQLYRGESDCDPTANRDDWYGKFHVSWTGNNATERERKLQPWLDPNNTGIIVLKGICSTNINITNQNITTDETVTSCANIKVKNVKVQNGAKLILKAEGEVTIDANFEVELGSQLEIW